MTYKNIAVIVGHSLMEYHGHLLEGIISQVKKLGYIAQALQSSSGNSEKCARTGGDEFVIIGCYDYVDEAPGFYKQRIEGYLARYNEISLKDYSVEASIGCFCGYVDEYKSVDECYKIADKLMYKSKIERKKQRTE